jgi:hypothetical protein
MFSGRFSGGSRYRVEIEADMVHRGQQRPLGSPGSATLLSEAYGCIHPRCRQQPRSDVVPPQLRGRCCSRRGKSSSWIIRCSLSCVSAISAESKTESSRKEEKSQPRRFSTMTQGRGPKGGFDRRFEMNLPVTATRCSRLLPVLPRSKGK